MLEGLVNLCLRHRGVVILAWIAIALVGLRAATRLPLDAFPDVTPVQVQVNCVAPALGAEEVERQVTAVVERALAGVPRVTGLRSLSRYGLSQVVVTFDERQSIGPARQSVTERLAGLALPPGVDLPRLGPVATGLGEVFHYAVSSDTLDLAALRQVHDRLIRPALLAVPGVAEVNAWGGAERQVEVVPDPAALRAAGLSLTDLAEALAAEGVATGGGVVDLGGEASIVQGLALLRTTEDVGDVVLAAAGGGTVRVRDVALVQEGSALRHGAVTLDGRGEIVLGLGFMLMGENGRDVTVRLQQRLDDLRPSLPKNVVVEVLLERTWLVDRVLRTVRNNLLEAALLVVAVLFIFLGNLRAGLIVATAIPLSLLFAFDLMVRAGVAGSLMSLGAIDFGLLVDSSVIVVENSMRRLALAGPGEERLDVVRRATLEVRRPTLFGELIILAVYLPILTLEGIEGSLFRPMALTLVFALCGSLLVSLTLIPVLSSLFLPSRPAHGDGMALRLARRLHEPALALALRHRTAVLALAGVAVLGAALLAGRLGAEFVPRLSEGTLVINTVRLSGISLEESVRYGARLERHLLEAFPDEIARVWTRTGTAELATDPMGIEVSDVFVALHPRERWKKARTQDALVAALREALAMAPGMRSVFTQPIEMRVNEMTAGVRADLAVTFHGEDLEELRGLALAAERILRVVPGATDVSVEQTTGQPTLRVELDRPAAARQGVGTADVLATVGALAGLPAGGLTEGEWRVPLVVRWDASRRADEQSVAALPVLASSGAEVPLEQVARVGRVEGPAVITREWGTRRLVVQANVRGRDVASFVEEARAALARELVLPEGVRLAFGGQFEHLQSARRRLLIVVPVALVLVALLLHATYGRLLDALRVFTGVPLAAVGGVLALWLRGLPFSVPAAVGFIALSGVAVLADMVLVSTVRQLRDEGLGHLESVREACRLRLRPVLMTALVASVGFIPMALSEGPGAEVQRPLATVVIGGIVSATLLSLVVLPVLYAILPGDRRGA